MIRVLIPTEADFNLYENQLRDLYEKNQEKICDTNNFDFVKNNTLFYMFLDNNKLLGAIYYFMDNSKLFLNGFSIRKNFEKNLECLKLSTTWFNCDIYAEAQNRASALCLIKTGFKRIDKNIFKLEKLF
jgi:hypothetical protein